MIVFGTGSYSLKTFSSSDLNLNPLHYDGHKFQIVQRYAHLFWIPFFPIGREYIMMMPGRSEKYHAPFDVAETMKQRQFPKINALLAFAIPLLLVGGLVIFSIYSSVSSSINKSRYESAMQSRQAEMAALLADKEGLKRYTDKVDAMYAILDTMYAADEIQIAPEMDTSEMGLLQAYIYALSSQVDTIAPLTESNTFVESGFFLNYIGSRIDSKPEELSSSNDFNPVILNWYHKGMPMNDDMFYDAADIKLENEKLDSLKYLAVVRYTGAIKPFIVSGSSSLNSVFQSGYGTADIYVYEIDSKKLLGVVSVLAENSEELHFTTNSAYGNSETNVRLLNDLAGNMSKEIDYALRFKERPEEKYEEESIEPVE